MQHVTNDAYASPRIQRAIPWGQFPEAHPLPARKVRLPAEFRLMGDSSVETLVRLGQWSGMTREVRRFEPILSGNTNVV